MKRLIALFVFFALVLAAADFWNSKPYSDWTDKDLQKIMTDSPWAKRESISSGAGPTPPSLGGGGGGGRGGGRGGPSAADAGDSAPAPISEKGGGGGGGIPAGGGIGAPSQTVFVRWQSALPLKQALVRTRFGKEAGSSPDAKKYLETEETAYVICVSQYPLRRRTGEEFRQALIKSSSLSVKGKDSIAPLDVQIQLNPKGGVADIYYFFPRQRAFTLEDGEVEFSSKMGDVPIKQKFKLKDMMFDGKLAL
jgi:hypothetical protein